MSLRRRLPVLLVCLIVAGGSVGCGGVKPPNVLLIVLDTTRADRCSVNGYAAPTTPEIERIAKSGVIYLNAWSPSGWTAPAHASLFTGLRPENHGLHRGNRHYLLPESNTLAARFKRAGYRTAAFSNNDTVCPENGFSQGFDVFRALYVDEKRPYPFAPATHREALEWAVADSDRPFFLFINDMEPHFRYEPPKVFAERFVPAAVEPQTVARARDIPAESLFLHNAGVEKQSPEMLRALSALYDGEIALLDHEVGRLIDDLEKAGLLLNTVVVITSDHGENFGEHGFVDHLFGANRALRHVPLVIRYPPRFEAGTRVEDTVRLEDIAPTLLEVCGLPVPPALDGESLLGNLPGRISRGLVDAPNQLLDRWQTAIPAPKGLEPLRANIRAVYDGRFHFLVYSDGREELFDVFSDPGETLNLAGTRADVTDRLRKVLPPW